MEELKSWYREQLVARIDALEAASAALREEVAGEARGTIRRIAHSLRGSGGTYGFPRITEAAAQVEEAADHELPARLENLLGVLRDVATAGDPERLGLLVIDDDPEVAQVLRWHLGGKNREIHVARSAEEAEQVLANHEVELIVLDLVLPDTDGRNLLMRLRERASTAALPVIVLTVKHSALAKSECFALGADEFFDKPFDAEAFATAVASKLQRSQEISRDSRQDTLTGLPNRAAFHEAFRRSKAAAERNRRPLSIGFLDLDHFKRVNDAHGHAMGDEVLRRAARVISGTLRQSDLMARWGGEEFVALFPETEPEGALRALDNARRRFRDERFSSDGESFALTFSAGVAPVLEEDDVNQAVARADYYLYLAKSTGRDRVVSESADLPRAKRKVLIAEDDELVATLIRHRLVQEGFEVVHYGDGESVLDAIGNNGTDPGFSLVILDVLLPEMDGFELLSRLRQKRGMAQVPIIVLTVMGNEEDVVRGLALGADDYVVKPFSPTELLARVHRLLKRQ
ncbi:MAG: response regulator [Gemmatimonadetes bacterium]|nr:response regulator [Gemmatimonadota bacterium]